MPRHAGLLGFCCFLIACSESPSTNQGELDGQNPDAGQEAGAPARRVRFRVTLENVSELLQTSAGVVEAYLAPGVWAVHDAGEPLFSEGVADRGEGLEALAEDGDPTRLLSSLEATPEVIESGGFDLPASVYVAGLLSPGELVSVEFSAEPGLRFSFAGMFAQSNDVFLAPAPEGILLFDAQERPRNGDVTSELVLWDAGSEVNEEPGVGPNQAPRQSAPNTGEDEGGVVRQVNDGFTYPNPFVTLTIEVL